MSSNVGAARSDSEHQSPDSVSQNVDRQSQGTHTSEAYINAIVAHAHRAPRHALYPGSNYRYLASFLTSNRAFTRIGLHSTPSTTPDPKFQYAAVHDLLVGRGQAGRVMTYDEDSAKELVDNTKASPTDGATHLIFLRGYPSCEWIKTMGSAFSVDPELFRRYLNLGFSSLYYDLPPLPTSSTSIITLDFCSLGRIAIPLTKRPSAFELMQEHFQVVGSYANVGQSLVRDFFWHNEEDFSMWQNMSLHVSPTRQGWTVIVMLDSGRELFDNRSQPWARLRASGSNLAEVFQPTIQVRPRIALENNQSLGLPLTTSADPAERYHQSSQSAALLHTSLYGHNLNIRLMQADSFYAVHGLYSFCLSSENQVLNLIQSVLESEAKQPEAEVYRGKSLVRFKSHKRLLRQRIASLERKLETLPTTDTVHWPRASTAVGRLSDQEEADLVSAVQSLEKDLNYLIGRARGLLDICSDEIDHVRNTVSLAESRKSAEEARGVHRLTLLAFVFVPLSFTTSFFGMNFKELGDQLSLWTWVAVTLPLCVLTLVVGRWNRKIHRPQ